MSTPSLIKLSEKATKKVWRTNFLKRTISPIGQQQPHLNLIFISSLWSSTPSFIQISATVTEKSPENQFSSKDNNSCKSRSTASISFGGCEIQLRRIFYEDFCMHDINETQSSFWPYHISFIFEFQNILQKNQKGKIQVQGKITISLCQS